MKLTASQLKKIVENYILEQEEGNDSESTKEQPEVEMTKYIKDAEGVEHEVQFKNEENVLTLHVNDQHFNPRS